MDLRDKYKIQESIEDVVRILDLAPIRLDLNPDTNNVQLTNRMPIAHLAIERGMKALIKEAGGHRVRTHALSKLHRELLNCDRESADFLNGSFCDAVEFYGYNVNFKGFGHFRSLKDYLAKVGGEWAFELLRYWAIGEEARGENPIGLISPPIHRELLCALSCLFHQNGRQTVSERVEAEVTHAMFQGRHIHWSTEDTEKRDSVCWYKNWLYEVHSTRRSALREAKQQDFAVKKDDELVTETLRAAFDELSQSSDPAVQYFVGTCSYLPRGSQPRCRDATPVLELNENENQGTVETPAGTCLGLITRYADGAWGITPVEPGQGGVKAIAEAQADAKYFLVNRLTSQVAFRVNGECKELRLVGEPKSPLDAEWTSNVDLSDETTKEIELWDCNHGIEPGDEVSFEYQPKGMEFSLPCGGTVTTVVNQLVTIKGAHT